MNKYLNAIFLLLGIVFLNIFLESCGDDKKKPRSPRIRKMIKVVSPRNGLVAKVNEGIKLSVIASQDSVEIESFSVRLSSEEVYDSSTAEDSVFYFDKTGKYNIFYTVQLSNGKQEQHSRSITFVSDTKPEEYTYRKINTYVHDPDAFIQGLYFENGFLYESTGQRGESSLRKVELNSGKILQRIDLNEQYFGEGITPIGDKIYMLTLNARKGFIYSKEDFSFLGEFAYATEGWGITTIGDTLVMSSGSSELVFHEPASFQEIRRIQVYDDQGPVDQLNELEYINGDIYANIWQTDLIVIVDPNTGKVKGRINLAGLFNKQNYNRRIDVLNGIAYDENNDRLFVTGKWWPKLFEIDLVSFQESTN